MKDFRWWLILAFALFMARPSNKRCSMCVDSSGTCPVSSPSNSAEADKGVVSSAGDSATGFDLNWIGILEPTARPTVALPTSSQSVSTIPERNVPDWNVLDWNVLDWNGEEAALPLKF